MSNFTDLSHSNGIMIKIKVLMRSIMIYMKWLVKIVLFVLAVYIMASCSNEQYPPISQEDSLLITVNIKDMTVTFIDAKLQERVEEWKMDRPYIGGVMLPDRDTLLLYGSQVETVDAYSLSQGEKISSWETGKGIVNGKLLKNKKEIVLADQLTNTVRFFTLQGVEIAKVKTESDPLTLLEDEQDGTLSVISYSAEIMTILDINRKEKISNIQIHASAAGALLREDANELWIGGHGEGTEVGSDIYVYDTISGLLLKKIHAPIMPINITQKGEFVYTLSHGSNTLYKFDTDGTVLASTKIGANPFEMKVFHDSLIVAGYDSNDIHFVELDSLITHKTVPVGKGPFQIILRE